MTTPVRLRLSRARGFDLQAHSRAVNGLACVNVARPSKWGNPFAIGVDGSRADCVRLFVMMLDGMVCLTSKANTEAQLVYYRTAMACRHELRGFNLACHCHAPKIGEPDLCHAAVLLAWVNNDDEQSRVAAMGPILERVFSAPKCEAVP